MTLTSQNCDENSRQFDIDLDRVVYDPEYRTEVMSALAAGDSASMGLAGYEHE